MKIVRSQCIIWLAVWMTSGVVQAQNLFERLVMPGELVEAHSKLEENCSNCHSPFSKGSQRDLCLDCHKPIAADVRNATGYHGKWVTAKTQDCSHCHTDHVGRGADIAPLDEETFDHNFTDFELVDAHKTASCAACHQPEKPHRLAPGQCVDCHKQIEPHMGRLGAECSTCHSQSDWKDTKDFDHSTTKFPLVESHRQLKCASCHVGEVYSDLPTTCIGCHRIQDVHNGGLGEKCESCHAPTEWSQVSFDHGRDTEFALVGKHAELNCAACHTDSSLARTLSTNCVSCHREDDAHAGQLGTDCSTCHGSKNWLDDIVFDHDIASFPLVGLHAVVPCEGCHLSQSFLDAPSNCSECHAKDDYHEGRLGSECATCHNPNGWQHWVFDHDRQTDYALTGGHKELDCHACHTAARAASLRVPQTCVSCHAADDKHKGSYGRDCQACHVTSDFKNAKLRR